jgi:hypothetical protein
MKKKLLILSIALVAITSITQAQKSSFFSNVNYSAGGMLGGGVGNAYIGGTKYFNLSKKRPTKFKIGLGVRATQVIGGYCADYITAPAKLVADKSIDTIGLNKSSVTAINLNIALKYNFTRKLFAEFNIDAVGFSFGAEKDAFLRKEKGVDFGNSFGKASPTSVNLLLVGDNDRGTLNSEVVVGYAVNEHWTPKIGGGYLFTEYTLNTPSYTNLSGIKVDNNRFRNKSAGFTFGVVYKF